MRIADKISNRILEELEDGVRLKIKKEKYLNTECLVADIIADEIKRWLGYDVDLNEFQDVGLSEVQ